MNIIAVLNERLNKLITKRGEQLAISNQPVNNEVDRLMFDNALEEVCSIDTEIEEVKRLIAEADAAAVFRTKAGWGGEEIRVRSLKPGCRSMNIWQGMPPIILFSWAGYATVDSVGSVEIWEYKPVYNEDFGTWVAGKEGRRDHVCWVEFEGDPGKSLVSLPGK